jgi:hypothetical protein
MKQIIAMGGGGFLMEDTPYYVRLTRQLVVETRKQLMPTQDPNDMKADGVQNRPPN